MARVVSRRRPQAEGQYGIKFTEIVVILMVLAALGGGVKYYFDYKKSPSSALQDYFSAVKGGNVQAQYDLLDEQDKANYFPTKKDYTGAYKQAHGYTERVVSVSIDPVPVNPAASEVTLHATVNILANSEGKELYQAGSSKGFDDKYVMRKNKDGAWKLVLSKSGDGKGTLNLENAQPTPDSQF
jgi:hypothetical protein